ncbi:unnamed protein product [Cuscuta campestris]|uniref:Uncharacterized protein n=1 Tax=Cuscuta campestris TaxID=132261 RepID=A0A484KM79_9ASTE|nr:unnamed protein product [Cuscuta campestris]
MSEIKRTSGDPFEHEDDDEEKKVEPENLDNSKKRESLKTPWTEGVSLLLNQAVESGSAVVLDDSCLDADIVYQRAVSLAQSAPPGPVFRHERKKVAEQQIGIPAETGFEGTERKGPLSAAFVQKVSEGKASIGEDDVNVGLRVDELAKLLA